MPESDLAVTRCALPFPFSATSAIGLAVNVAFYGLIFVFSLFFQNVQGFSALQTGLAFVPTTVAVMAGNLLAPRCAAR